MVLTTKLFLQQLCHYHVRLYSCLTTLLYISYTLDISHNYFPSSLLHRQCSTVSFWKELSNKFENDKRLWGWSKKFDLMTDLILGESSQEPAVIKSVRFDDIDQFPKSFLLLPWSSCQHSVIELPFLCHPPRNRFSISLFSIDILKLTLWNDCYFF